VNRKVFAPARRRCAAKARLLSGKQGRCPAASLGGASVHTQTSPGEGATGAHAARCCSVRSAEIQPQVLVGLLSYEGQSRCRGRRLRRNRRRCLMRPIHGDKARHQRCDHGQVRHGGVLIAHQLPLETELPALLWRDRRITGCSCPLTASRGATAGTAERGVPGGSAPWANMTRRQGPQGHESPESRGRGGI
jgi:hypothetical protein